MPYRVLTFWTVALLFAAGSLPAQEKKEKGEEDKKKAAAVKKDQDRLQGAWEVVEFTNSGEALPAAQTKIMRVVFTKDQMAMSLPKDAGKREYGFTLDPTQTPKAIDLSLKPPAPAGVNVKLPEGKGLPALPGVYEFDGENLKLCLARLGGKIRPTEFASTGASNTVLIVLKRGKK